MRHDFPLCLLLGLTACSEKEPSGVNDLCGTDSYGYGTPSDDAKRGLEQTNCYRNLMGLSQGVLHPQLDEATQQHANYMASHNTMTHSQDASKSGFTGEWVWDRIEAAGYSLVGGAAWMEVVSVGYDPAGAVDGWMGTVYHRIPFTQAVWTELGFGQEGAYSAMTFVTPYPDGVHQAVGFPVDGQSDVPVDFDSDSEYPDPAPDHGTVGYPITVTVSGVDVTGPEDNPYELELIDAVLWGPGGEELDVLTADPNTDIYLYQMASMLPIEPLEPGVEYEAEMTIRWDGDEETVTTLFTTAN
ncbi:MAG: CAP domain-containing protein [Myxococcota bacterium]